MPLEKKVSILEPICTVLLIPVLDSTTVIDVLVIDTLRFIRALFKPPLQLPLILHGQLFRRSFKAAFRGTAACATPGASTKAWAIACAANRPASTAAGTACSSRTTTAATSTSA